MSSDPYYKKTVPFSFQKTMLEFNLSQQLFSSFDIDQGSKLLLKTLVNKNTNYKKTLDLGCGYGVIGLTLKKLDVINEVHLIDRDALALEYTKQNAELNKIENIKVYESLGYDNIKEKFDLIVSNIPAKVGEPVHKSLLLDAKYFLNKNGIVAIVVVKELEEFVGNLLQDENIKILLKEKGKHHTVFHYQFTETTITEKYKKAFTSGVYDRDNLGILRTVYGLPEFDSLNFNTQLLLKNLRGVKGKNILIHNSGQGHIALSLLKSLKPNIITLFDRDLLTLENTKRNLILQGFNEESLRIIHSTKLPELENKIDLAVFILRNDDSQTITEFLVDQIAKNVIADGSIILSGKSTQITRAIYFVKSQKIFTIKDRKKWRGESILLLQKSN